MHVRPIIYTRENIRNKYQNDGRLKKYDFWVARYNDLGPNNFDWHFWQITEKGILNGYNNGRIDINLFKGDYVIVFNIFFVGVTYPDLQMNKYFLIFLLVLSASMLTAQTRRALVIGIGQQEDKAWKKINGDEDVAYAEEMLRNAQFETIHIKKLTNRQATKAAIVDAFEKLAEQSNQGDVVYVHFSGHGQQMRDVHNDETDGLDECWIPYDAYQKPCEKDRGEKHLTDDEVNYYLNAIRDKVGDTGKILVVIDACHSGDGTRGSEDEVVRGVEDVFEAIKSYIWGSSKDKEKVVNPDAKQNNERWITISACESDQVNIEMKSPAVGKLTYALYKKVKENANGDNDDFIRQLRMFVNQNTGSRPQRPVMTGETRRYRITDIIR